MNSSIIEILRGLAVNNKKNKSDHDVELDNENHLTASEYAMIVELLSKLIEYKHINEGPNFFSDGLLEKNYDRTPIFATLYSKEQLRPIVDKMKRRMDMFDGGRYNHTCW